MLKQADCPYCGEPFETTVDTCSGSHDFIEDCPVCCRPVEFHLETGVDEEVLSLTARRDDD